MYRAEGHTQIPRFYFREMLEKLFRNIYCKTALQLRPALEIASTLDPGPPVDIQFIPRVLDAPIDSNTYVRVAREIPILGVNCGEIQKFRNFIFARYSKNYFEMSIVKRRCSYVPALEIASTLDRAPVDIQLIPRVLTAPTDPSTYVRVAREVSILSIDRAGCRYPVTRVQRDDSLSVSVSGCLSKKRTRKRLRKSRKSRSGNYWVSSPTTLDSPYPENCSEFANPGHHRIDKRALHSSLRDRN